MILWVVFRLELFCCRLSDSRKDFFQTLCENHRSIVCMWLNVDGSKKEPGVFRKLMGRKRHYCLAYTRDPVQSQLQITSNWISIVFLHKQNWSKKPQEVILELNLIDFVGNFTCGVNCTRPSASFSPAPFLQWRLDQNHFVYFYTL